MQMYCNRLNIANTTLINSTELDYITHILPNNHKTIAQIDRSQTNTLESQSDVLLYSNSKKILDFSMQFQERNILCQISFFHFTERQTVYKQSVLADH